MYHNLGIVNVLVAPNFGSDGHDLWILSLERGLARLGKCPVEHRPMLPGSLPVNFSFFILLLFFFF
jgi:hypothetical protein